MFLRRGVLTAAVASFLLGLAGLSGMHSRSRGVTPVQEAVVSVNGTAHADTPPTTDKPSEFGGSPTDKAVAVTIVSKDPADDGAWNVSTGAGVVPLDEKGCPPCDNLFGMLRSSSHHRLVQDVHMQIRGEPKSGTSFMFEWAVNALMVTCSQLGHWYGRRACSIMWAKTSSRGSLFKEITDRVSVIDMKVAELVFERPRTLTHGGMAAPCHCKNVDK